MNELAEELRVEFLDEEYAHAYVEDYLNASIATQIKVIREQRSLNQEQLANLCEMKQSRISILENVNYSSWSIKTLMRLARAFDVTLRVSFESFDSRIDDITSFSKDALQRDSRTDALSSIPEQTQFVNSIIDMAAWSKSRNKSTQHTNPFNPIPTPDRLAPTRSQHLGATAHATVGSRQ